MKAQSLVAIAFYQFSSHHNNMLTKWLFLIPKHNFFFMFVTSKQWRHNWLGKTRAKSSLPRPQSKCQQHCRQHRSAWLHALRRNDLTTYSRCDLTEVIKSHSSRARNWKKKLKGKPTTSWQRRHQTRWRRNTQAITAMATLLTTTLIAAPRLEFCTKSTNHYRAWMVTS